MSRHRAAIGLGSNLGDSVTILKDALSKLDFIPGIRVAARSHLYQTAPIGPPQPDYLNACAILETALDPQTLLQTLLHLEKQFGRIRRERWGARTLDIDLLLYDNLTLSLPDLQIPHPRMSDRAFVLVPLAEIVPDWVEPVSGRAISALLQQVDRSGVARLTLNLP